MKALPLLILLLAAQDDPFAKAKDKFLEGIESSDAGRVRNTLEAFPGAKGDRAARALLTGLQKSRDRLRLFDRSMMDALRALDAANAKPTGTGADRADRAKSIDATKARIEGLAKKWGEAEEIHDLIRRTFGMLRSGEAASVVAEELDKSEYFQTRIEMADALGAMEFDDASARLVGRLAREDQPGPAAAILEALGSKSSLTGEQVGAISAWLSHKSWQVQVAAAQSLAASGAKPGVEGLITSLRKLDGRPRLEVNAALKKLTRMDLYGNPDAWEEWWKNNKVEFLAGRHDPLKPNRPPGPASTFFEMPVTSKRIAIAIDRSRSMLEKLADGKRKIDVVKAQLKTLVASLPDGTRLHLHFFNERTETVSKELDAKSRKDLATDIDKLECEGITDFWEPLEKAFALAGNAETGSLREDGIDTLYFLSDGEPTHGKIVEPELLLRVVARVNRILRLAIHTISVGDSQKLLSRLADQNGGSAVTR